MKVKKMNKPVPKKTLLTECPSCKGARGWEVPGLRVRIWEQCDDCDGSGKKKYFCVDCKHVGHIVAGEFKPNVVKVGEFIQRHRLRCDHEEHRVRDGVTGKLIPKKCVVLNPEGFCRKFEEKEGKEE